MFLTVQYVLHRAKHDVFVLPADLYGKYKRGPEAALEHLRWGVDWLQYAAENGELGSVCIRMRVSVEGNKYELMSSLHMYHRRGSSWHGGDAKLVFWIERYWKLLLAAAAVCLAAAVVLAWRRRSSATERVASWRLASKVWPMAEWVDQGMRGAPVRVDGAAGSPRGWKTGSNV